MMGIFVLAVVAIVTYVIVRILIDEIILERERKRSLEREAEYRRRLMEWWEDLAS